MKTTCSEKIVGTLLEDYVERWIEITDRGGLVKANEEFYSFVLKIEEVALLRKNQKEDMRKIFKVKLKTVPEVLPYGFVCLDKYHTDNYQINFLNKLLKSGLNYLCKF